MIEILTSGALNTVQDLGRYGYRNIGVSVTGAMDKLALAAGNILLGNPVGSAGLEITMFPFRMRINLDTCVVISGACCTADLGGKAVLPWWTVPVRKGQTLELHQPQYGSRAYLTLRNGIDVPLVLDSRSTDLKAKFGGHDGRALKRGDRLSVLPDDATSISGDTVYGIEPPQFALPSIPASAGTTSVRVIPAGEYDNFPKDGQIQFWNNTWRITHNSNRQGYRLAGPALPLDGQSELLSYGLVPGTIQVPPSGQPIIQLSDANTSGGYPKIGAVIEADLWRLAQARLGDSLQFIQTTTDEAITALATERAWLKAIQNSVAYRSKLSTQTARVLL